MNRSSARAVFLDRDGVLNRVVMRDGRPCSPRTISEFEIVGDGHEALSILREAGYLLIVATNQPEVSRGLQERSLVDAMHDRLMSILPLDEIRTCFHDRHDGCKCRKPEPGLLVEAARERNIRMQESFMIGDRGKDVEAGRRAGCRTVLLRKAYNKGSTNTEFFADSLLDAARLILRLSQIGTSPESPLALRNESRLNTQPR